MRTCTLCGTTDPKRFAQTTRITQKSSYCISCTSKQYQHANRARQGERNKQIRGGLK